MGSLKDLEVAFEVADQAAALALGYFEAGVVSTPKVDGSPVTEADLAVERLLRDSLRHFRPEDAVLGEEHGQVGDSERLWILDPIDGTGFFSRRDPNWRVHVALEVCGVTELAVVTSPALPQADGSVRYGTGRFRYVWPPECDLMAQLAGLEFESRWARWDRSPFTSSSPSHVSVWRKPGGV